MDELTVRDDRAFREYVRTALDEIKKQGGQHEGELKNVVFRLDTLNGSVARHEAAIGDLRMKQSVDEASDDARREVSREWWNRMKPIVYLVLGWVLALLMKNGPDLLKLKAG